MKILIFIGLLVGECYCFNFTEYLLQLDERINSILLNPVHGKDESLLKDLIQFSGINYHFKEAIRKNETEFITPMIQAMLDDFTPKCVERIETDEYQSIAEDNQHKFNWTRNDFIYFDSFAKDVMKLWYQTVQLLRYGNDTLPGMYLDFNNVETVIPLKYNTTVPVEDRLCWESYG